MEEAVYDALLKLHEVGEECKDPQFSDFIEGEFEDIVDDNDRKI